MVPVLRQSTETVSEAKASPAGLGAGTWGGTGWLVRSLAGWSGASLGLYDEVLGARRKRKAGEAVREVALQRGRKKRLREEPCPQVRRAGRGTAGESLGSRGGCVPTGGPARRGALGLWVRDAEVAASGTVGVPPALVWRSG